MYIRIYTYSFGSCQNCISSANLAAKIHQKLCNKRVLSTGEPCTMYLFPRFRYIIS